MGYMSVMINGSSVNLLRFIYYKFQGKNSSVGTYFTNRALCYLKLKQWEKAVQDCKRALEIDCTIVKGHFFLGQALLEVNSFDEAITSLARGKSFYY